MPSDSELQKEIDSLRQFVEKLKREEANPPMSDSKLQKECFSAATFYIEKKMGGATVEQKALAINCVSRGFWMGVRFREKLNGEKHDE